MERDKVEYGGTDMVDTNFFAELLCVIMNLKEQCHEFLLNSEDSEMLDVEMKVSVRPDSFRTSDYAPTQVHVVLYLEIAPVRCLKALLV